MHPQDFASSEDMEMMDSEDEFANSNNINKMFVAILNDLRGRCVGRGWNTCDNRRDECRWICSDQRSEVGCCVDRQRSPNNNPTRRPTRRPQRSPTRRPTRRPQRSPTPPTPTPSDFENGLSQGRQTALNLWRDMGNDCANAWNDFRNSIDREISARGWNSGGNWRTNSFNQGARDGMQQVLKEKEEQCFHDSPDECIDLGNEAARIIAFQYCNPNLMSTSQRWDYRATCRAVAISQCSGQVAGQVRCRAPNTSTLRSLQNKCSNQVRSMIGDYSEDSEDYDFDEDSKDLFFEY